MLNYAKSIVKFIKMFFSNLIIFLFLYLNCLFKSFLLDSGLDFPCSTKLVFPPFSSALIWSILAFTKFSVCCQICKQNFSSFLQQHNFCVPYFQR